MFTKFTQIVVIDSSDKRGYTKRLVPNAEQALQQIRPQISISKIEQNPDKAIQDRLLRQCWDQLSSSQEADILAMLNSPEALLLRIRGSHAIKQGCDKLAKRLLDIKAGEDTVQGLYERALWDEGKSLKLWPIGPVILPISIVKLVFYVVTVNSAKNNVRWFRLLLLYIHRPWLEIWYGHLPYTAQFLFEYLHDIYPISQKKISFSKYLEDATYRDYSLRLYCLKNGLLIRSPWRILNYLTKKKLEAISQMFCLSEKNSTQYLDVLSSFHKHYKNDRDRMSSRKLPKPNDQQLYNMIQELQPSDSYTTKQLLQKLHEIAKLYKDYYIAEFAGVLSSISLDQPLGKEEESAQTLGDTKEDKSLEKVDPNLRELLEESWYEIEAKIPIWILEEIDLAFQSQVRPKGDKKELARTQSIFYLRICQNWGQEKIAAKFDVHYTTILRELKKYPGIFVNVRNRIATKVIQAVKQQEESWQELIGNDLDRLDVFYQLVKSWVHEHISPGDADKELGTAKTDTTDTLYRRQLCQYLSQFKEQHNG